MGERPLVAIDDGGHGADEMRGSFEYLFPRLAPCGLFVMEDLAESYAVGSFGFIPTVQRVLDDALHYDASIPYTTHLRKLPHLADYLASIHCFKHLCVFYRNDKEPKEI